jgi:hypothetical protein
MGGAREGVEAAGRGVDIHARVREAAQVAATLKADGEKSAKVRAVKLTAEQAKRAAFLASFGQTYARKDAEPAGTWVAGKGV